ncbi:hypothetical protein D3C77_710470 [compost metagenome]
MQQRDGVEDALDDPQLLDFQQVNGWRAPPVSFRGLARGESGFLFAKPVWLVNQSLPKPTFLQGEPNCRAADVQLAVPVVILGVPTLD